MKTRHALLILASLLVTTLTFGQSQPPKSPHAALSVFAGVWRGKMDNLPALVLTISDERGNLSGAALFYLHKRQTINDPWTATPGVPEPLFNLRVEGNTLSFQISHKRAHPPQTMSDHPVNFRLTLIAPNRARAAMDGESGKHAPGSAPLIMVRTDY